MIQNNLILVKQHFHTNGHNFRDGKFTVIERIEKNTKMKSITEIKEKDKISENMYHLDLTQKFNHPNRK